MTFIADTTDRKETAILKILKDSPVPLGARLIGQRLQDYGYNLSERAVRYHLKFLDERGLTYLVGQRDGRCLTDNGREEAQSARVAEKVGFAIARIETLSFQTTFDPSDRTGLVPVNISFYDKSSFGQALKAMKPAFDSGYCVSNLVAVAAEGETLGEITVPPGKMGFATVCSIVYNGVFLKAGIPVDSRYGGILQYRDKSALRFIELIDYAGCSLDPSTIFIKAGMTSLRNIIKNGNGELLGNFREIPAVSRLAVENLCGELEEAGMHGLVTISATSEAVCEIPVGLNRIGIVLLGGLNPVAAAEEAGICAENNASSTLVDYKDLLTYREAAIEFRDLTRFWLASNQ